MPYSHLSAILKAHHINRFALAVSGGADSMAMLKLAAQYRQEHHSTLHALIVDHKLRPESTKEASHVGDLCQALDVPCTILTWEHTEITSGLQERARQARYQLLSQWCKGNHYKHLLLAHHANDLLETFMMRLSKGSSLKGLCGLEPVRDIYGITLVRPFLFIPSSVLHTALGEQEYIQDPSNDNIQFERVRLRKWLAQFDMMEGFLKSYTKLEQVNVMIMRQATDFADKHIKGSDIDLGPLLDLDPIVFAYVIKTCVVDDFVEDEAIARLHHALLEQKPMTLNHKKFMIFKGSVVRVIAESIKIS